MRSPSVTTRARPILDPGGDPPSDVVTIAEPATDDRSHDLARSVRHEVVRLVRERRYEEALSQLYAARAESPDNKELYASIQQIKEFLVGSYAKKLGGLDRVAGPLPASAPRFPDALLVTRYIDGVSTFDDIRRSCPLGQLRTLQVLVALYSGSPESIPPLRAETPPPPAVRSSSLPPEPSSEPLPETQRTRDAAVREVPPSNDVRRWFARPVGVDGDEDGPGPRLAPRASSVTPPPVWAGRDSQVYELDRPPSPRESPEDAQFKAAFARGTAAFVQRRFQDAVTAFRECERLRPSDNATATMLRRAIRDAQGT